MTHYYYIKKAWTEKDVMLWLSVLESIPSQWKRKVKSHNMKIVDDVSAGPSITLFDMGRIITLLLLL